MRSRSRSALWCLTWLVLAVAVCPALWAGAQDAPPAEPAATPAPAVEPAVESADEDPIAASLQRVSELRASVAASTDLTDAAKQSAVELLDAAAQQLAEAQRFAKRRAAMAESVGTADEKTQALRATLEQPARTDIDIADEAGGLDDGAVEARHRRVAQDLEVARQRLDELSQRVNAQHERPKQIASRQVEIKHAQQKRADELAALPELGEPAAVNSARDASITAQVEAMRQESALLELEAGAQATRLALLLAQRDAAARQVQEGDALAAAWSEQVAERQRAAHQRAKAQAQAAQQDAQSQQLPGALQAIATDNVRLAQRLADAAATSEEVDDRLQRVRSELSRVERQFTKAKLRLEASGLTLANGVLLRTMQDQLPETRDLSTHQAGLLDQIGAAEADLIDLQDLRAELADRTDERDAALGKIRPVPSDDEMAALSARADELLTQRYELVESLLAAQRRKLERMNQLNADRAKLNTVTEEFDLYIRENLLWAKSMPAVSVDDVRDLPEGVGVILSPKSWGALWRDTARSFIDAPTPWASALAFFVVALIARLLGPRWMKRIEPRIGDPATDSFTLTLLALGLTALMALPAPILLHTLGTRLFVQTESHLFTDAMAAGFLHAAAMLVGYSFLMLATGPHGLGPVHFRWDPAVCATLRRTLLLIVIPMVVMRTLMMATEYADLELFRRTVGRPSLLLSMALALPLIVMLFRPKGALHRSALARPMHSPLVRAWPLWFAFLFVFPLAVIALAVTGYYYTALHLDELVARTFRAVLLILVASELLIRLLRVEYRRMVVRQQAKDDAADDEAQPTPQGTTDRPPEGDGSSDLDDEFGAIRRQSRALINSGLVLAILVSFYVVWSPVLPALMHLDQVRLWSYTHVVGGEQQVGSVTLLTLALVAVSLALLWVAVRNLPGLLDLVLLSRLPMDRGARYAIQSVLRYVVIAAAVIYLASALGMQWDKLQWLVAALSVGLGFGLQEIVANFVCGLIILAERPFRIGDRITVGTETGTVTRIHIRATTIANFDQQEIIMPNKTLITSQVTNWSLSNEISRLVITVALRPGADPDAVRALLLDLATGTEHVLDEPAPAANLSKLLDGTLQFSLRAYVALENRLEVTHQLNRAVDRALREAGLELVPPRRDLTVEQRAD